jgi:hypothetical protein
MESQTAEQVSLTQHALAAFHSALTHFDAMKPDTRVIALLLRDRHASLLPEVLQARRAL